uniref:Uncharacterized protein n=1 Tax=Glossina pallidipes TaxID=7398 RepID=A0A1A9ZJM1_GLOPL
MNRALRAGMTTKSSPAWSDPLIILQITVDVTVFPSSAVHMLYMKLNAKRFRKTQSRFSDADTLGIILPTRSFHILNSQQVIRATFVFIRSLFESHFDYGHAMEYVRLAFYDLPKVHYSGIDSILARNFHANCLYILLRQRGLKGENGKSFELRSDEMDVGINVVRSTWGWLLSSYLAAAAPRSHVPLVAFGKSQHNLCNVIIPVSCLHHDQILRNPRRTTHNGALPANSPFYKSYCTCRIDKLLTGQADFIVMKLENNVKVYDILKTHSRNPQQNLYLSTFTQYCEPSDNFCMTLRAALTEGLSIFASNGAVPPITNAYASAERCKMEGFGDFKRIVVVCLPNEDELKRRLAEKKEKDEYVYAMKESTLNNIQGNYRKDLFKKRRNIFVLKLKIFQIFLLYPFGDNLRCLFFRSLSSSTDFRGGC